jgi:hypothetical protein
MGENDIKENPQFKKLREEAEQLDNIKKIWPLLKPIAQAFGSDTEKIDDSLNKAGELITQINEMTSIPDQFNDLLSDSGWILFDELELEAAKEAIQIANNEGIERADEFLADHISPDWVESRMIRLKFIESFKPRYELAQKAAEDYKAGRYYASVLVILALIDGWVSELNIVDFQRIGFFAEKSELIAWDSIAAHPKGLVKLKKVMGIHRMMTRSEEIRIPYRHGIVHGMDLGYDNKYVAAKCWAALFAVKEWVLKTTRDELNPPAPKPEVEKTLWETIESYYKTQEKIEKARQWQPRVIQIGETIPPRGAVDAYSPNMPERKIVEFLNYWLKGNYGYMAKCFAPIFDMKPVDVRESFFGKRLLEYDLVEVDEIIATAADIHVNVKLTLDVDVIDTTYEFRLVLSDPDGELAIFPEDNTSWGLATWRHIQ